MTDREPDLRPSASRGGLPGLVLVLVLLMGAFVGWRWWQQRDVALPVPPSAMAPAPDDGESPPAAPPVQPPAEPQNTVDAIAAPDAELPPLAGSDAYVQRALSALLGGGVAQFLQVDGFVNRVVATVDALPRGHAAPRLWPVRPTPGRMMLEGEGRMRALSPENAARYTPFVRFASAIDASAAAKVYARLYPLFQRAYEELGYPGRYFNDRLVAVIDHLLATPRPEQPVAIRVVEVHGEVASEKPWVRYEFADPRLESLSSGQKLLVRMGPDNAQRLEAKLREIRAAVATVAPAR